MKKLILNFIAIVFFITVGIKCTTFGAIHGAVICFVIALVVFLLYCFSLLGEAKEQRKKVYKNAFKDQYISDKW